MATINAINSDIPISISKGGTNATSMTTTYAPVYYDSSKLATIASVGSATNVLTSNGAAAPTFQAAPSPSVLSVGFTAYRGTTGYTNITGDGTVYTWAFDTEFFDLGADFNTSTHTFTAPSTGKYPISANVKPSVATDVFTELVVTLVTSNRNYRLVGASGDIRNAASDYNAPLVAAIADMDTSDTLSVTVKISGSTKTCDDVVQGVTFSFFSAYKLI